MEIKLINFYKFLLKNSIQIGRKIDFQLNALKKHITNQFIKIKKKIKNQIKNKKSV